VIEWAKIEGFRAIRSAEFTLKPLTFFLGPNGSGKTSILNALNLRRSYQSPQDHWRHRPAAPNVTIKTSGRDAQERPGQIGNTVDWYQFQSLTLDLKEMRQPVGLQFAAQLEPYGRNLTNVFDTITRRQREAVVSQFCQLVPTFADVDRIPVNGSSGTQWLRFQDRWNPDTWYSPYEVSDGSLLVLAFLLLQHQSPQPDVVAIEEPERGLHPYLLEQLVQLLRSVSQGAFGGKPVQLLLATHSPQLVEFAQPEEVRFVDRDPKTGDVTVRTPPTEEAEWTEAFSEYKHSLGAAWLSGALGGV